MHPFRIKSFVEDRSGGVTAFFVILVPLLLLIGGLATDISQMNAQKRYVQSQADLAAQAAARHLPDPDTVRQVARGVVRANTLYDAATLPFPDGNIHLGQHVPGQPFLRLADHDDRVNAVEVVVTSPFRPLLLGAVLPRDRLEVTGRAVGVRQVEIKPVAAFTVRNRLLSLNTRASVLAAVLEPLGLSTSLGAVGYDGLANTRIKVDELLGLVTLGTAVGAVTFDDVLNLPIRVPRLLVDLQDAGYLPEGALTGGARDTEVTMGEILAMSPQLADVVIGNVLPDIELSMLDLLTTMAGLAAGDNRRITLDLGLDLSPLAAVGVEAGVLQRPVTVIGSVDDEPPPVAESTQVDVGLTARLATLIGLRLDLQLARARAQLVELDCDAQGDEPFAVFEAVTTPVRLGLALSTFREDGSAFTPERETTPILANATSQRITFTRAEADNPDVAARTRAFETTISVQALPGQLQGLLGQVRGDVEGQRPPQCSGLLGGVLCAVGTLLGAVLNLVNNLVGTLNNLITQVAANLLPIDAIVQSLLRALGVDVAPADLILESYQCGTETLGGSALAE